MLQVWVWPEKYVVGREGHVGGADRGGAGRGLMEYHSQTGTPPGPCSLAGSCHHHMAASCPRVWGPERLTGGDSAPHPASCPSHALY